jgi:hypothetical protein
MSMSFTAIRIIQRKRLSPITICPWRKFDNISAADVLGKRFFDAINAYCPGGINLFAYFRRGIPYALPNASADGDNSDNFVKVLLPKIAKPLVAVLIMFADFLLVVCRMRSCKFVAGSGQTAHPGITLDDDACYD